MAFSGCCCASRASAVRAPERGWSSSIVLPSSSKRKVASRSAPAGAVCVQPIARSHPKTNSTMTIRVGRVNRNLLLLNGRLATNSRCLRFQCQLIQFQKLLHDRLVRFLHLFIGAEKNHPRFVQEHDTVSQFLG